MVRPYAITALATATALGATDDDTARALRRGTSGLVHTPRSDQLPFDTWTGTVPTQLPRLSPALAHFETRQTQLIQHLLADIHGQLDNAKRRWGTRRIGVALGTTTGGVAETEDVRATWESDQPPERFLRERHNHHASVDYIRAATGIEGPALVQSSACSSSSKVFATARRLLDLGVVDAMLVGGVDSRARFTLLGFHGLGILSEARCRPFSATRNGINLGEGGGLLLVERDGPAKAWLRGVGETSDAYHMTQPRPDGSGLEAAMRQALSQAGMAPDAVDLINAHATGTALNDAAEALAIARTMPHQPLVVATKAYTGHTLGACGAVEIAMCIRSLQEGWAPGTLTDGPWCEEASALRLSATTVTQSFKTALNVSAAFAGHNAAVLLEAP